MRVWGGGGRKRPSYPFSAHTWKQNNPNFHKAKSCPGPDMGKIVHQSWCHIWHVAHECYGCSPVHDMQFFQHIFGQNKNKLRPILEFEFGYTIEQVFVICSSLFECAQNTFFHILCFSNSRSMTSTEICPCIHPVFPEYAPVSTPSSYCTVYRAILVSWL